MVGGDGVERAVAERDPHRFDIGGRAQRGVDLEDGVVRRDDRVVQREVVGRGLGGDGQARALGRAHRVERRRDRQVQEVHARPGQPRQRDVAQHHQLLGLGRNAGDAEVARPLTFVHVPAARQRRVLAVLGERDVERGGVLERAAHEPRVLHARTVVGEEAHAQRRHLGQRRQSLPRPAHGDGARHVHVARRRRTQVEHLADDGCAVDGRVGVGHRDDGRVAPERGGAGAGVDCLRLFTAGLTEMRVQVDEAGRDRAARRVEHLGTRRRVDVVGHGDDVPGAHEHVGAPRAGGVDHRAAADDEVTRHGQPPSTRA